MTKMKISPENKKLKKTFQRLLDWLIFMVWKKFPKTTVAQTFNKNNPEVNWKTILLPMRDVMTYDGEASVIEV